ncbi:hypothetical protein D3C85_1531030 [compost metagenome]
MPAFAATAVAGELAIHLQIQRTPHQLQPFRLVAGAEVFLEASVNHNVGVQLIEVELVGEYGVFEAQAEAVDFGVFAGIDLSQQ